MTVYVLEKTECSGIFSTKEKAIKAARHAIAKVEGVEHEYIECSWGVEITFSYKMEGIDETDSIDIYEYELDQEYNC